MDKILIKDLLVRCVIGVSDDERREKQDVTINIVLLTDTHEAGRQDDISAAVNYRDIKKRVMAMAEKSSYHLVETLAERVSEICLAEARVHAAQVTVEKPSALRFARSVGVEIVRERS